MGGMKVDISGFEEMRKQLENTRGNFDDFLRGFLIKEALRVLAKTKKLTPTTSNGMGGVLRSSWQISNVVIRGSEILVYIYNPMKYASYVEYGHVQNRRWVSGHWDGGVFIYEPGAKTGMMLSEKWIPGAKMCTIALQEIEERMPAHFNAEFKKWVKSMGVGK
ncbi:MAG: HK97 gp10 family phage protein [Clostridiales bacterium]